MHNAERLTDMVSSLLDLSRIEYGELKLNFEELDLNSFFKTYVQSLQTLSKKKNIDIIYKANHKGKIIADSQAFERIMNNLIAGTIGDIKGIGIEILIKEWKKGNIKNFVLITI